MNRFLKPIQVVFAFLVLLAISGCGGQATAAPTATVVDVSVVMTSAAATAYVQLTQIAGQSSATIEPSRTPTIAPATDTNTPDPLAATATQAPALELITPTATDAGGGLPAAGTETETQIAGGELPAGTGTVAPSLTPLVPAPTANTGSVCYNSKFVADVSIPDGSVLKPGDNFRKVWRIQNTGTCKWGQGFGLTIWAGPAMGGAPTYFSSSDPAVEPGGTIDLGIDMIAPSEPGDYVAHWVMTDNTKKTFGGDFTIVIKVAQ